MIEKPSDFKAHFADKIMREIRMSKLKSDINERTDRIEKHSSEEKKDDRIDLVHKKIAFLKYLQ